MSSTLKTEKTEPEVVAEVDPGMGGVDRGFGEMEPSEAELAARLRMAVTRLHRRRPPHWWGWNTSVRPPSGLWPLVNRSSRQR
jgi:hypothetical protein